MGITLQALLFNYLPFLIIGTAGFSLALIITTLIMCLSLGHLSYKNIYPTVSMTGANNPEHIVYEVGFTIITLLMLFVTYVLHVKLIKPLLTKAGETWRRPLNIAAYAVCCVGLIGLVLQSYMPCKKEEKVHYNVHMAAAMVFFVATAIYITVVTLVIFPLGFFRFTLFFKFCSNAMNLIGGVSCLLGYGINKKSAASRLERAISEWVTVFGFVAYFLSFSVDLLKARSAVLKARTDQHSQPSSSSMSKQQQEQQP